MKKKSLLALIMCVALAITSCGSDTQTSSTPSDSSTASTAGTEKMMVTYMQSGINDEAAKALATEFAEETGVEVEVVAFPWDVLRQNNTTDILSGNHQYSVMSGGAYLVDIFSHMTPLTEYIERDGFGEGLIPGLMDKTNYYEGEVIGIPYNLDAYGIVYRKDLFEEYGIELPKTWDEFYACLDQLKEKLPSDIAPYVFAGGAPEQVGNLFLARYGGYYINSGNYEIELDKAAAAIDDIIATYGYGPNNISSLSIDQANAMFLQGKAAVTECWPSFLYGSAADPSQSEIVGKWGIAPYPTDGGVPFLSCWNMFIPKEIEDTELAWKWVDEFASEENSLDFFLNYNMGPIYSSTYQDPQVIEKFGENAFDGHLENVANAYDFPMSGEGQDIICRIVGDALVGKITSQEAAEQINQNLGSLEVTPQVMELAERNDQFIQG